MSWPTTFANLAAGNQPLSLFDVMFNQVAQMVAIPSTAAGTNALTLTPIGSAPALSNYQNFSSFRFVAPNNSTAAVTAQYQALASLPVYLADGATQVTTQIVAGQEYVFVFIQALTAGGGGFILESASVPVLLPVAGGVLTNLLIKNNVGTPNTQLDVTYDELVMNNLSGGAIRATAQSFTINGATAGVVNGIDTGALVASTWYAVYGISNGATAGGLLSTSFSAPAMPLGYTFRKRIGAFFTDGSAHFFGVQQRQRRSQYINGGNLLAALPTLISGVQGATNVPTWVAAPVANFVPPSAIAIGVVLVGQGGIAMAAPNNSYGVSTSATNGPPLVVNGGVATTNETAWWLLEGANVFYASGNASTRLQCLGWEDNI